MQLMRRFKQEKQKRNEEVNIRSVERGAWFDRHVTFGTSNTYSTADITMNTDRSAWTVATVATEFHSPVRIS
jgi:hypothetical protein